MPNLCGAKSAGAGRARQRAAAVSLPAVAMIALCLIIERVRPAGGVSFRQLVLNINYSVLRTFLIGATDPIGAAVIGLTVAWAGGGLNVLPSSGRGLLLGV